MSELRAQLSLGRDGNWVLKVLDDPDWSPVLHFSLTENIPSIDKRIEALSGIGYEPRESAWTWSEPDLEDTATLLTASIPLRQTGCKHGNAPSPGVSETVIVTCNRNSYQATFAVTGKYAMGIYPCAVEAANQCELLNTQGSENYRWELMCFVHPGKLAVECNECRDIWA